MGKEQAYQLTPIEARLLQLLSHGYTEKEVALQMNKSVFTIDKYMRTIFDKYGIHNTTAVVAEALRRKEIE